MKIKTITSMVILLFPFTAQANFFGPDNYEECLLEKMKGQNKSMLHTARKACEKKFPFEKELNYYKDNIEISWYADQSSLNLSITENYGNYGLTKYKATFSEKKCADIQSQDDYNLEKTFIFEKGTQSASVIVKNASQYQCMRTERIWGKIKESA